MGTSRILSCAALVAALATTASAQTGAPKGGASTGGVFAARRDAKNRPITAGGFVDGATAYFDDDSAKSGLTSFTLTTCAGSPRYIVETTSGGVALFDFDGDGWLDVYLVNGPPIAGVAGSGRSALFRNERDGTFEDVTAKAGVSNDRFGMGVCAGDFDGDGRTDLYVTNVGKSRLYRNKGDGTFEDVAERAGVTFDGWATGATFGDYDGDGRLDLFVAGYVEWDFAHQPAPGANGIPSTACAYRGVPVMCGPRGLPGQADKLYRNLGDGKFEDVSAKSGVADTARAYGFSATFVDVDDDGLLDLAVANDSRPNYLYRNKGDGTFEDVSLVSGFALNESGREQAGMGLAVGDYDNDGRVDLFVTNFSDDTNTLRRNEGGGNFADVTAGAGVGESSIPFLGWGAGFVDVDNDGLLDLFAANGHVYPEVDKQEWGMTFAQRPLLYRNRDGKRFDLVPPATGSGLAVVRSARGAAFGDVDNDGDVDVILNCLGDHPVLLRDRGVEKAHWLTLALVGKRGTAGNAIGAVATVTAAGVRRRGYVISGGSYCSQSDFRVHVGLGAATKVDAVEVRWPSGAVERFAPPAVDRIVTLTEGTGTK